MEVKRKIIAIWLVLLLVAVPVGIAGAEETHEDEEPNETFVLEFAVVADDGSLTSERLLVSEEDLVELQNAVSTIMNEIESMDAFDWSILRDLIERVFGDDGPFAGKLLGIFSALRLSKNRGFVISSGRGTDFSPLKRITFKIRKKVGFWHYNSNDMVTDKTIIVKPLALNTKILNGRQFGIMTGFLGIYISVSKGFLRESYTMFMGTARRINGVEGIQIK